MGVTGILDGGQDLVHPGLEGVPWEADLQVGVLDGASRSVREGIPQRTRQRRLLHRIQFAGSGPVLRNDQDVDGAIRDGIRQRRRFDGDALVVRPDIEVTVAGYGSM